MSSKTSIDKNVYFQNIQIKIRKASLIVYLNLYILSIDCFSGRVIEDANEKQNKLLDNYLEHVHNKFNK